MFAVVHSKPRLGLTRDCRLDRLWTQVDPLQSAPRHHLQEYVDQLGGEPIRELKKQESCAIDEVLCRLTL